MWHEGQFIKGIDWIDWALLLDLPAVAIPACMTAIKKRREFKQNLLEADAETAAAAAAALRAVFGVKGMAVQADGTLTAYLWPIGVDGRDLAAACAGAGCATARSAWTFSSRSRPRSSISTALT